MPGIFYNYCNCFTANLTVNIFLEVISFLSLQVTGNESSFRNREKQRPLQTFDEK